MKSVFYKVIFLLGLSFFLLAMYWLFVPAGSPKNPRLPDHPMGNHAHHEIANLEEMWKEHPDHSPIALQLANLYAEQGNNEQAVKFYRAFLATDTSATGWEARLDLCRHLFAMNKVEDAKKETQWILDRYPSHAGALYNMGAILANTGKQDSAKIFWQKLISLHPQDTLAIFASRSLKSLDKPVGHP